MRKTTRASTALLAATLVPLLYATPAGAQNLHSWVTTGGTGSDCVFVSPCADFNTAMTKTISGGEIRCKGAGFYPPFTIDKAISIVCDDYQAAVTSGGGLPIAINIKAGPNDIVSLNGFDIDEGGLGTTAITGIVFQSGAALHLNKIKVRNTRQPSDNAGGIYFQPNTDAQLYISDSIITGNSGGGSLSGGIVITPSASASVNAFISRVKVEGNSTGIIVDGKRSTGAAVNAIVLDSVVVGSTKDGILAQTSAGKAPVSVFIDHSVVSGNIESGVRVDGPPGLAGTPSPMNVRISDSTITLNDKGVSSNITDVFYSYKNNRINGNKNDDVTRVKPLSLQ
jgi:hypothetical protein